MILAVLVEGAGRLGKADLGPGDNFDLETQVSELKKSRGPLPVQLKYRATRPVARPALGRFTDSRRCDFQPHPERDVFLLPHSR